MLVAVPVPVTIADCALLSDRSLQTLLQVIMVEGDAVVADWNAEAASAIGAMQKAAKKSEAAADALRPSRLREEFDLPYAIIVREPIEEFDDDSAPGPARRARVPHSAADIEDVERHVVRIVDSRAESRALLYSLQLLVRSQPLRPIIFTLAVRWFRRLPTRVVVIANARRTTPTVPLTSSFPPSSRSASATAPPRSSSPSARCSSTSRSRLRSPRPWTGSTRACSRR